MIGVGSTEVAFLQQERETTSNAARKSGDLYKEQGERQWIENYKEENIRGKRGIWLNRPDRILAEGRQGDQILPGGC